MKTMQIDLVIDLFDQAVKLNANDQTQFMVDKCGDDVSLRFEVETLLYANTEAQRRRFLFDHGEDAQTSESSSSDLIIEGYQIVERLGEGGFGVVYLARRSHVSFGQLLALKVLKPGERGGVAEGRFRREIRTLALRS